jgi:hypothetical protein
MRMGIVAVLAILMLAMAAPAHAQRAALSGGSTANAPQMSGGGGGGGGFGGGGGVSGGHSLPQLPQAVHYTNASAHGTEADFQLTSFVPYEQAVRMGEEALAQPVKTLGEIAAEYRAEKAARHMGEVR